MLIDHLVYAVPDLRAAVADVEERLGVRAHDGGRHTGLGTHNALLALGPATYLEIIAADPGQPEPARPRPFGIDGITRSELAGWALACEDIDATVIRARRHGYDPGEATDGQRTGPTGTALHWRMTSSAAADGLVPFLISWGDTEHPASSAPGGLTLEAFHLEHPDPASVAAKLAALGADVLGAGVEIRPAASAALAARLSGPNGSVVLR